MLSVKHRCRLIFLFLMLNSIIFATDEVQQSVYCIGNNVNIRLLDDTFKDWDTSVEKTQSYKQYKIIGQLYKYDKLIVHEITGNWAFIYFGNMKGWVAKKYLLFQSENESLYNKYLETDIRLEYLFYPGVIIQKLPFHSDQDAWLSHYSHLLKDKLLVFKLTNSNEIGIYSFNSQGEVTKKKQMKVSTSYYLNISKKEKQDIKKRSIDMIINRKKVSFYYSVIFSVNNKCIGLQKSELNDYIWENESISAEGGGLSSYPRSSELWLYNKELELLFHRKYQYPAQINYVNDPGSVFCIKTYPTFPNTLDLDEYGHIPTGDQVKWEIFIHGTLINNPYAFITFDGLGTTPDGKILWLRDDYLSGRNDEVDYYVYNIEDKNWSRFYVKRQKSVSFQNNFKIIIISYDKMKNCYSNIFSFDTINNITSSK